MKKLFFFLTVVFVVLAVSSLPFTVYADHPPMVTLIPIPRPTFPITPLDFVVNIPDANLRAALHTLTGVPAAEEIYQSDLAALSGSVNLENKSIANAEGVQYCKNITYLSLSRNDLTNLPSMTGMGALQTLRLSKCSLASWPSGKLPPNLRFLDLSKNSIKTLPDTMTDPSGTWRQLDLSGNGISKLPDWLFALTALQDLNLSDNKLASLSSDIANMIGLKRLNLSGNKLESLPAAICTLPALLHLSVSDNSLYNLPSGLGYGLKTLTAKNNRLGSLPKSIGDAATLYLVDVMFNRLTSLPSSFDDHDYDFINVEFNFIDMSSGSKNRKLIEDTVSMEKYYLRQLKPVTELMATPAADSVTLTWQPGEDGSKDGATWTVKGYVVYKDDGGLHKLADIDKSQQTYVHTGLSPDTVYQYRVGIDYRVSSPAFTNDVDIREYTRVKTTTLSAEPSALPSESAVVLETPLPTFKAADEEAVQDVAAVSETQANGFPVWGGILIGVLGAGIVGTGVMLLLRKLKKIK